MTEQLFVIENNNIDDPRMNLALEEYSLRHLDLKHIYLLLYINRPSVIIGRNQNPFQEINSEYIAERGISVVRRVSGGGAVYHDYGNLNYSFITRYDHDNLNNFKKFTAPVIAALRRMGVPAELNPRNSIVADDKKISGTAQYATGKGILTHGTLLFDARLDAVYHALNATEDAMASRAVQSVRSPVVNIADFFSEPVSMGAFKTVIRDAAAATYGGAEEYRLSARQWAAVNALSREKYHSWHWNFGRSPRFSIRRSEQFDKGSIDIRIEVDQGRIKTVEVRGRFPSDADPRFIERRLVGCLYRKSDVGQALSEVDLERYFGNTPQHTVVDAFIKE